MRRWLPLPRFAAFLASLLLAATSPARAATIVIVNGDPPGLGLNDPMPVSPVGGNTGTTLGAQRLILFQEAARIWGALLPSNVTITVRTSFSSLPCSATESVLGSAGPTNIFSGFPNAPVGNTWYVQALANKLANAAQNTDEDISANFNADFGTTCPFPRKFYLGLDNNHGPDENLLTVVLHELGHGLGFISVTGSTGAFQGNRPSIFERNLLDLTLGKSFDQMTNAERATSLLNFGNVVWKGDKAINYALANLARGRIFFSVSAPAAAARNYEFGTADFGPAPGSVSITGQIVAATDASDAIGPTTTDGCSAFTNASQVAGKIALIDRGTCNFTVKVKNAQNAGAVAAIIADKDPGTIFDMGGTDATITIPAISVTKSDGAKLRANLPAIAFFGSDPSQFAGADSAGRLVMYTPSTYAQTQSLGHWDTGAFPNLLMEPNLSDDLRIGVDATLPAFRDIGWFLGSTALPTTWALPSSAHAPGANNAFYTTGLTFANTGAVDATLVLKFLGHDQDGSGGPQVTRVVPAGQTVTYADVLNSLFSLSSGFGAIRIVADTNNLKVVSQTSTPPPSGVGTFGQAVPAATGNDFVTTAAPKALFSLRQDAAFRTNAVIANATEAPAHVDLQLYTSSGALIGTGAYDLNPLEMRQIGLVVTALGGPDGTKDAVLRVSTPTADARIATYAAVIDQKTNDPRTILPVTLGTLGTNGNWLLPSSARAPGKNNAFYTTDLTVANSGSTAATSTLKFLGHDQDGRGGAEVVKTIPANSSATYTDVLGSLFGLSSGFGAILVTSNSADLKVLSQTSTPPPDGNGTYGQSVPAFGAADLVTLAAPRALVGLREDAAFRTNAVIANATDQPAHVDLTLKSETGATIGTGSYDLLPYEMRQIGTVVTTLGGPGLQGTANAALWVSTTTPGARIATYAAVIDNITNDPRTILP